ncbi:hypothetical protein EE612_006325 [Oryza sativa]|nr:hypothetical protein EE612_006325 [Oryza sativa]
MITGSEVYQVVEAMAPLYTAAALGYGSVRWLKAFSNEQCAGINHFVALYAVPVLIFDMVSTNNVYKMNGRPHRRRHAAEGRAAAGPHGVGALGAVARAAPGPKAKAAVSSPLQWVITCFSVASLPNTIIMGVPLLNGMYGPVSKDLMKQIVVMQFCIWYNVIIFLYEYMAARRSASAPPPASSEGSAKISPSSPVKAAAAAADTNGNAVAADRPQEVAVNIEITEMAASTARDGVSGETTAAAKEVSSGEVAPVEEEEASAPAPSMKHVIWMAVKKLLQIPNTYASFLGLIWSLIAFKCGFSMPKIVEDSLFTIRTTAVGLSMFFFRDVHSAAVAVRAVRIQDSVVLHGHQVSDRPGCDAVRLARHRHARHTSAHRCCAGGSPLAVTSFVYAEEYKVHADIMSTGVILGIFISLPVTIVYYILLGL